jgi:hypothetical protein
MNLILHVAFTIMIFCEDVHTFTMASVRSGTQWETRYFSSSLVFTLFCMPDELLTFFRWSLTCRKVHSVLKFAASAAVHDSAIRFMYKIHLIIQGNYVTMCIIASAELLCVTAGRQQQQHIYHYIRALFCARLFDSFVL